MALLTRLSRLLQADLHAMLDQIEEPDVLLKQSIREMEVIIAEDEQHILGLNKQLQQLRQGETECRQTLEAIEQQLDICFSEQQHELARSQIKRKLEIQQRLKRLSTDQTGLQDEISTFKTELERKRIDFESMRQQADVLLQTSNHKDSEQHRTTQHEAVRDEDVEIAFLREQQIRSQS